MITSLTLLLYLTFTFFLQSCSGDDERLEPTGCQHSFGSEDDERLVPTGCRHSFWSEDDERLVTPGCWHSFGRLAPPLKKKLNKNEQKMYQNEHIPRTNFKLVHKKQKTVLHMVILEFVYPDPQLRQILKPIRK